MTVKRTYFNVINYISLCEDCTSEEDQSIYQEEG